MDTINQVRFDSRKEYRENTQRKIDHLYKLLGRKESLVLFDNFHALVDSFYNMIIRGQELNKVDELIKNVEDLSQENKKLVEALLSVEESIDNAHGEVQSAESYLMTASTTIDNLNLDD